MKILIEESVLRQAIKTLERCYDFPSDQGLRIEGTITALRSALDAAKKIEDQLATVTKDRDELVEALERIVDTDQDSVLAWVLHDIANEALAKVGAGGTGEVVDPSCTCDEHGACAYCWNGKKHDAYSDGMTPRDDQEFLSKTDGLDGPVEGLQANQDCGIRYVE